MAIEININFLGKSDINKMAENSVTDLISLYEISGQYVDITKEIGDPLHCY